MTSETIIRVDMHELLRSALQMIPCKPFKPLVGCPLQNQAEENIKRPLLSLRYT